MGRDAGHERAAGRASHFYHQELFQGHDAREGHATRYIDMSRLPRASVRLLIDERASHASCFPRWMKMNVGSRDARAVIVIRCACHRDDFLAAKIAHVIFDSQTYASPAAAQVSIFHRVDISSTCISLAAG